MFSGYWSVLPNLIICIPRVRLPQGVCPEEPDRAELQYENLYVTVMFCECVDMQHLFLQYFEVLIMIII